MLQHVLPKGLRRARNFGFLHHNSARAIRLLQVLLMRAVPPVPTPAVTARPAWQCVCGQRMRVVAKRLRVLRPEGAPNGQTVKVVKPETSAAAQAHTMQWSRIRHPC